MARITVHGEATVPTEPDAATLQLSVTALDREAPAALADVTARAATLATVLDELGVPPEHRTTTGVTVQEELEYRNSGRRSLGHRATAAVLVRLEDAAPAGRLIAEATSRAGARVDGPRWHDRAAGAVKLASRGGDEMPVDPGTHAVSASVLVTFALEP